MINWNENCPNVHCMGGIITYDGTTGRLCRYCNPIDKKMKNIKIDPPIDTLLPLKDAHKQVALEWIIKLIDQHDSKDVICDMIGINLKSSEFTKVKREIIRVKGQLQYKVDKIKGNEKV